MKYLYDKERLFMKLHYQGKFNGDPTTLINQRQVAGATKFKEPNLIMFSLLSNTISIFILVALAIIANIHAGKNSFNVTGMILAFISLFPHEVVHALCFKGDVYLYTALSKGLLFVVGSEDMNKGKFIFMCLLPNIAFGLIPFIIFLINPVLTVFGTLGVFAIAFGAGDYMNAINALIQMPRNAVTYMYQQNSYWYIPKSDE